MALTHNAVLMVFDWTSSTLMTHLRLHGDGSQRSFSQGLLEILVESFDGEIEWNTYDTGAITCIVPLRFSTPFINALQVCLEFSSES